MPVTWQAAHQIRTAYRTKSLADGRRLAEHVLASLASCPIPEIVAAGGRLCASLLLPQSRSQATNITKQ